LPGRFSVAVERCRAYVAAGADCTYPFGLRETDSVAAFVKAVAAPVNVTGRPGMPDAAAFERIGVARITIALAPTLVAMAAVKKLATELRASGSFDSLAAPLYHPDAQELFQSGG
jgi:2-methylisocitrate lyase-like PEP mutase family enzyme